MNDRIAKFHTICRKYCIDILNIIKNKNMAISERFNIIYKKNNGDHIKALDEFEKDTTVKSLINELNEEYPNWSIRKEILEVILRKIESRTAEEFDSFNQIKEFVINECNKSEINEKYHFDISNEMKIKICNDEKKKFYDYINSLDEGELTNVEPLFYRRVLPEVKIREIKKKIDEVCYRYDLENKSYLCFKKEYFEVAVRIDEIINILAQHEVRNIYEINTGGIDTASYTMDLSVFNPYFTDGFNIYWCSEHLDWVIIKDHEGYYFIYGEWLAEKFNVLN